MNSISPIPASEVPRDPTTRREWIKFQLRIRGASLSDVARDLGLSRFAVNKAMSVRYPRVEAAIAERLGLVPEQIWPERYASEPDLRGGQDSGRSA